MIRFFVIYFILITIGMSMLELPILDNFYRNFGELLAILTGNLIRLFDSSVIVNKAILTQLSTGFALEVTRECLAVETTMLFSVAVFIWHATWQQKLRWLLPSILLIQIINIVRLITLLYLGKWFPDYFDLIHENLWPLIFVLLILMLLIYWSASLEDHKLTTE